MTLVPKLNQVTNKKVRLGNWTQVCSVSTRWSSPLDHWDHQHHHCCGGRCQFHTRFHGDVKHRKNFRASHSVCFGEHLWPWLPWLLSDCSLQQFGLKQCPTFKNLCYPNSTRTVLWRLEPTTPDDEMTLTRSSLSVAPLRRTSSKIQKLYL